MTELWRAAPRTPGARAAHDAAEADRLAHPEKYTLDVDRIAEAAAKRGGSDDFVAGWRDGLEHYLGSAVEDGRLNALGTRMAASTAIGKLRAGAAMAEFRRAATPAPLPQPPLVITGGWRTGTTFLFRLLGTDPRLRAPLPAELSEPVRVACMTDDERASFIHAAGAAHEVLHVLNPELRAIHDSGATLPEECVLAMGTDLRSWGSTSTTRLNSYATWLAGEDLSRTYEQYRYVIEALDRDDGRRWVLKAPAHLAELPHLATAFPGAVVVHLHRDIVETIASGASLFATFRTTYSDHVDAVDVGQFQADQTELWLRRAVAFRASSEASSVRMLDLSYRQLVAEPAVVVRRVYEALELEPPADVDAFIAAYDASYPRHAHGGHTYDAVSFGLDVDDLRERFAFYEHAS